MGTQVTALVVEPDRAVASQLVALLHDERIECSVAASGDEAWTALARRRPDLILVTLGAPALDRFHRRLRDEYLGQRPRLVGVAATGEIDPEVTSLELDGVLLGPLSRGVLSALAGGARPLPSVSLDVTRLREMVKMTCLGSELQASLVALAHRLALVYSAPRCTIVATASERHWLASAGSHDADDWADTWMRCEQAVHAGAPVFAAAARGEARVETRFAVPVPSPGGAVIGAILLATDGPALFADSAREALVDLAARLGLELSWRSVHDRLAAERDRLRETAMLDPMAGVLSRTALEQAIATELARQDESGAPLAIAVLDLTGLRHINDRFGHLAGDAAIRHLADVTRRSVRPQDMVGRSGGDEIAVLFPGTPIPAATVMLDRLRRAIESQPYEVDGSGPIFVRVGIGVTEGGPTDEDGVAMLVRATRSASAAGRRGGAIAIADRASPSAETRPNLLLDRYEAGVTLGGMYQIVHEISRGSMGVVYRAEDLGLSRPVALKMLRPDMVRDVDLVKRFREEAAILAALNHENLVHVYSFVEDRDDVFFVMELVEGVSLDGHIGELSDQGQFIAVDRAAAIVAQVASALDAMHHAGVMHRDVKPGNVVLDRTRDRPVLVDVGLARRLGDSKSEPAGTPGYIAPESFRGDPESPATDVYGLAATAYAILTGRPPFGRADDYHEILRRQIEESPPPPSSWRHDLSPAVDDVLLRGMAIERDARFATAGDLARALEVAIGSATLTERMPAPELEGRARRASTAPGILGAPGTRPGDTRRTMPLEGHGPRQPEPLTRGVVFRGVTHVLGVRAATAWIRTIERSDQALADALSLRTSPMAWLPTGLFVRLMVAVATSGRNPQAFARELGSVVVQHSFQRFYPSSPESLSPGTTLRGLDILWRRYHSWGELRVLRAAARTATVQYEGTTDAALCAFTEGWLEQVLGLSGGASARVAHVQCATRGASACELAATWG
ncbi:MAG TPA: diguanylate cyclase [Kofleriaceae bacterium]|nr:diguanylate cyclase [Kofleriaceae bacterium]